MFAKSNILQFCSFKWLAIKKKKTKNNPKFSSGNRKRLGDWLWFINFVKTPIWHRVISSVLLKYVMFQQWYRNVWHLNEILQCSMKTFWFINCFSYHIKYTYFPYVVLTLSWATMHYYVNKFISHIYFNNYGNETNNGYLSRFVFLIIHNMPFRIKYLSDHIVSND